MDIKEMMNMPLLLLGTAMKVVGAVGLTISGAVLVTKVLIDAGIVVP